MNLTIGCIIINFYVKIYRKSLFQYFLTISFTNILKRTFNWCNMFFFTAAEI